MSKFLKIENTVINVDLICAVTERFVQERIPSTDDSPYDEYVRVQKGINVFFGVTTEESFIHFENETVDSFLEKIKEVAA
ncbi:hypothetical protein ACT4Z3_16290 [Acinetobacter baumannii]